MFSLQNCLWSSRGWVRVNVALILAIYQSKNRLHKVWQVNFPELENLLSTLTGEQYLNLVMTFPYKEFVLRLSENELWDPICQSTFKRISEKRIVYLNDELIELAKNGYENHSDAWLLCSRVASYFCRQVVFNNIVTLAQPFPEYNLIQSIPSISETTVTSNIGELGAIRRLQSTNQINAFIGIDLRHYESGNFLAKEHITKRGNPYARKILFKFIHNIASASHTNPCHIADFYEKRKRQSTIASTKPHTIASIHVSFEQCITSLRITNFTITLCPKIGKAVYAVLL